MPYGDLSALNRSRRILDAIGIDLIKEIVADYLELLDTSAAVYEKTGDYALGLFASNWCRILDTASRNLCNTENNRAAINSGKWLCHESCWKDASLPAIESGKAMDVPCKGGIRLYAVPIFSGKEIVGAINFGYGNPPKDFETIQQIAKRYEIDVEKIEEAAQAYEFRPPYIIEYAKRRLHRSANLIGKILNERETGTIS